MPKGDIKKVVLAYSGGLDTSIILKWLQTTYGCEVVTFTADLGQGEELAPAREKALLLGIKPENIFIEDLREEFVRDYVFPMFRANALYEGIYLLGTSIARPLIAKKQIEIAHKVGADAVCHGATGKGNDQVRFELTYYALDPSIKIIAPWREWSFKGRDDLLAFAREHQIPIAKDKEGEAPFSVDANLLHSSSEGKVLEDPAKEAPPIVYQRTISPMEAPDKATEVRIGFDKGDAVSLDGKKLSPATILTELNALGKDNGIGRIDLVENRFVGMKSRGVYETPGGTILLAAHRAIELITLDRGAAHLKDELMPRYAELIYNGFWFTPEREMLQALIDKSQEHVEGEVRLKLYKGNVLMAGRESREVALFLDAGHLRGRQGRLRPEGRRGLHPAQRAAAAHARHAAEEIREVTRRVPCVRRYCQSGAGRAMRNLFGKIALTTGSALIAGGLLVVAYLAGRHLHPRRHPGGGVPGRREDRRGAIRVRADRVLGRDHFRGGLLGADRARRRHLVDLEEAAARQTAAALSRIVTVVLRFSPRNGFSPVILALANSNAATSELDGPSHSSASDGVDRRARARSDRPARSTTGRRSSSRFSAPSRGRASPRRCR